MSLPRGYSLRPLDATTDRDAVLVLDAWAFPDGHEPKDYAEVPLAVPFERSYGVQREGTPGLAAMFGAYPLRSFPVPGAEVPCAFLTWVGVHPGHRRRGILRHMMGEHFERALENGEAVSALWAAEAGIYGRFGYGLGATGVGLSIPRRAALRPVPGSEELDVELANWDAGLHGDVVAGIHAAAARVPEGLGRPGWAMWETPELRAMKDNDAPVNRNSQESRRLMVIRDGDIPVGYATFRRNVSWTGSGPGGPVNVSEAVALTPAAAHRLWTVLLDLDLTTTVSVSNLPADDPVLSLLVDVRAAKPTLSDNLWVRLVDVPAALAQRRYAADVDVVIEVADPQLPANAGRWRVRAAAWGHADVTATDAEPDLRATATALGAAHLGSVSLASLSLAGHVESASAQALAAASAAWAWPVQAACNWVF